MLLRSDELQIYIDDASLQECNCHIFRTPNSNKFYFLSEAQGILQERRCNFNRQKLPEVSKIYVKNPEWDISVLDSPFRYILSVWKARLRCKFVWH